MRKKVAEIVTGSQVLKGIFILYPLFKDIFYKVFGRGMEAKVPGRVCLCFQGESLPQNPCILVVQ